LAHSFGNHSSGPVLCQIMLFMGSNQKLSSLAMDILDQILSS
jgi:hypothetical protein